MIRFALFLILATVATLVLVPVVYSLIRRAAPFEAAAEVDALSTDDHVVAFRAARTGLN